MLFDSLRHRSLTKYKLS